MYTNILKFGVGEIFLWKKSLILIKAALFVQTYSKKTNIVKYCNNLK